MELLFQISSHFLRFSYAPNFISSAVASRGSFFENSTRSLLHCRIATRVVSIAVSSPANQTREDAGGGALSDAAPARRQRQIHQSGVDRRLPWRNSGLLWSTDCYISGYGPLQQTNGGRCRYGDAILHHQHTPIHTGIEHYQFARRCNAWRSLRQRRSFSSRSTRSRDLLQWAVGLQHQRRRRLFTLKAAVAA